MGNIAACGAGSPQASRSHSPDRPFQMRKLVLEEGESHILESMNTSIDLQFRLQCIDFPTFPQITSPAKYPVIIKLDYQNQSIKWSEGFKNEQSVQITKKMNLIYQMSTDQIIRVQIFVAADVIEALDATSKPPYGTACFHLNEILTNETHQKAAFLTQIQNGEEVNIKSQIKLILEEEKPVNFSKVVFQMGIQELKVRKGIIFSVYKMSGQNKSLIYKSEEIYPSEEKTELSFDEVTLLTDIFEGNWENKTILLQVSNTTGKKSLGHKYINMKEFTELSTMNEIELDKKNKKLGKLVLREIYVEPIITFLDLMKEGVRFIPIIAIDFSLGNLTFGDQEKCLHHRNPNVPNIYIHILKLIDSLLHCFYEKMLGFGYGARLIPKKSETSNCFAINGDAFDPWIASVKDMITAYREILRYLEIILPVNLSGIFKLAGELGRRELAQHSFKNYYVLYVLTAGVLDDPDEALNEAVKMIDLPLSIVLIKVGNPQMAGEAEINELAVKCEEIMENEQRKFISVIDYPSIADDQENIPKYILGSVPLQMLHFYKNAPFQKANTQTPKSAPEEMKFEEIPDIFEVKREIYIEKLKEEGIDEKQIDWIMKNNIPDDNPSLVKQWLDKYYSGKETGLNIKDKINIENTKMENNNESPGVIEEVEQI